MADKYEAGDDDPAVLATGLAADLKAIGFKGFQSDLKTLIQVATAKGAPDDDRQLTMEKLIAITASLPSTSKSRVKLTHVMIDQLWGSLQHPPLTYLGNKFQYRTPDGSYNNILYPQLGAAGTPYAKTVRPAHKLQGVRPDPGLLFDLLLDREKGHFKENPAGLSSVLFYNASIIIHDIFRSNRKDPNISDTSSYLDLAPLYGSNLQDQLSIRTLEKGLLKPDTYCETRLLGQPPGVNVILVMYSRFHNYCADMILKINEGGRFTLGPYETNEEKAAAIRKQDEDLFQTARLITGGLYINICMHDYLRGLTNSHHSKSDWTLDPRQEINKTFDSEGTPRGIGNQISCEFNLMYRFHSVISKRDEKWLEEFFASLFTDLGKPLDQLTPVELWQGLAKFEASIPKDPSKREFGGIKRGPDGKFKDEDLVRIFKESTEDPAGSFGARTIPKALRVIEVMGILQARKWQVASLNEFRDFFNLKRYEKMEDVSSDPEIADLLRKLYNHPDMIELYPGLLIEDTKPVLSPGHGGAITYTLGRAIFSDAVTLVRSDRFNTIDYTPATLTNWGFQEVKQDYKTLGGSMFYKLIQRAVPGWFPFNSLHIMQPMYTRKMNETIAKEIGTIALYTTADPAPPPQPVPVFKNSIIRSILKDQASFAEPVGHLLAGIFPGSDRDFSHYMLYGDAAVNTAQRNLVGDIVYGSKDLKASLGTFLSTYGGECLTVDSLTMAPNLVQIDIIRDVALPVSIRLLADLWNLDLNTPENPDGSLSAVQLHTALANVRAWQFAGSDVSSMWTKRRRAQDGATLLTESTEVQVQDVLRDNYHVGWAENLVRSMPFVGVKTRRDLSRQGSLRWYGRHVVAQLLKAGKSVRETSDICWLNAVGGTAVIVGMFAEVLQFFLKKENEKLWSTLQDLAAAKNPESDKTIREYVLEAQRLTTAQTGARICAKDTTIEGKTFTRGQIILLLLGIAGKDGSAVPDPAVFKPGRPKEAYLAYGWGAHECFGREIAIMYCVEMIKLAAGLKNLRPAPGDMGLLKTVMVGQERLYLSEDWSTLTMDATTWKLHYEGLGKGLYQTGETCSPTQHDLDVAMFNLRKAMEKARKDVASSAA